MNITICQLHDDSTALEQDWEGLVTHVRTARSDLVLLPDMPFHPWLARSPNYRAETWYAAIDAHNAWEKRFPDMAPAMVATSRPIDFGNERYDEGFVWSPKEGMRGVHAKAHLESSKTSSEATWYQSAEPDFVPVALEVMVGFLIGAELHAPNAANEYARQQVPLLLAPRRATASEFNHWFEAGRHVARNAGAYVASSNHCPDGGGWLIDPQGESLAVTSEAHPFVTVTLDLPINQPTLRD